MNRKQIWLMWIGMGIVCIILLFPPWKFVATTANGAIYERSGPYRELDAPPLPPWNNWHASIDWERMFGPLLVVILLDAAGMITCRKRKVSKTIKDQGRV
jgi:hypothetical protein